MTTPFTNGLDLSEGFFRDVAEPLLIQDFPDLRFSAGLIGSGSEVLGYDDAVSTDHNWGPRFHLFLPDEGFRHRRTAILAALGAKLPPRYRGYSTSFTEPDPLDGGTQRMAALADGKIRPLIHIHTIGSFFRDYLGHTLGLVPDSAWWLTVPEHRLLAVGSGRIFRDELDLDNHRALFRFFPPDVWMWQMASVWAQIAEEEAFPGRCRSVGDDLGSRLVTARQVQRLMRLGFLQERRFAPYSKWLGTAFSTLAAARVLAPVFERALAAPTGLERDTALGEAYVLVGKAHNSLGITPPVEATLRPYFGRPYQVIAAGRFATALLARIDDPVLRRHKPPIGSVGLFTDSTAVADNLEVTGRLRSLYRKLPQDED